MVFLPAVAPLELLSAPPLSHRSVPALRLIKHGKQQDKRLIPPLVLGCEGTWEHKHVFWDMRTAVEIIALNSLLIGLLPCQAAHVLIIPSFILEQVGGFTGGTVSLPSHFFKP